MKEKAIALYMRLSLEDGDGKGESNSISAQRQILRRQVEQTPDLSLRPTREYIDDGHTGTNFNRPQFQRMMQDIRTGMLDTVMVKDLSRFGRDYLEVGDYLEHTFPFLGVRMISVNDGYDSKQYVGKTLGMDLAFRNLIYDYYSKDLSQKVKTGMRVRQEKGAYVTSVPFGYQRSKTQKHQMVIDPFAAEIVREIFARITAGESTSAVAAELNRRKILTPNRYKGIFSKSSVTPQWTHNQISCIIRNIKYTGTMVNHLRESRQIRDKGIRRTSVEEQFFRENAHEAIIPKEDWERANAQLRTVRGTRKTPRNDIDRVYFCGHCGRKLQKSFGLDTYYFCPSAKDSESPACLQIHLTKTEMEGQLLSQWEDRPHPESESSPLPSPSETRRIDRALAALKRKKLQQYEAYKEGNLTREAFLAFQESYLEAVCNLEAEKQIGTKPPEKETPEDRLARLYSAIDRVTVLTNESWKIEWKGAKNGGLFL